MVHQSEEMVQYWLACDTGDVLANVYPVFPGIVAVYLDASASECSVNPEHVRQNILEIEYCRQGQIARPADDASFGLSAGNVAVRHFDMENHGLSFPLNHYQGITIVIDLERCKECLSALMTDLEADPAAILEKFHLEEAGVRILCRNPNVEYVFSELYDVPEPIRKGYLRLKITELILLLMHLDLSGNAL